MNHSRIAAEALRYRLNLVRRPLVPDDQWDLDRMAGDTVAACDPSVDSAIRRIATAWVRSGLDPTALIMVWTDPEIDRLFTERPELVDALDDIVRVATRRRDQRHTAA